MALIWKSCGMQTLSHGVPPRTAAARAAEQAAQPEASQPVEAQPEASQPIEMQVQRVIQAGTHSWGYFRMTWRAASGNMCASWQATCRFHGHHRGDKLTTRCARSAKVACNAVEGAESEAQLRELKAWLLAGKLLQSKEEHQALRDVSEKSNAELDAELATPVDRGEPSRPAPKAKILPKAAPRDKKRKRDQNKSLASEPFLEGGKQKRSCSRAGQILL